ncbi:MAG: tetratricopeptide repeat protein [Pirellulales bacterium]
MAHDDSLLQTALELHRAQRIDEARAVYQQIVDAQPQRADALGLLGIALRQLGRNAEALEYLRRAVTLDPTQAAHWGNLGEVHRLLGNADEALACYAQAVRLAPFVAELHSNLGSLLQDAGRFDEAAASYAAALGCDPNHPDAHYNLGNLQQISRQWDQAAQSYRRALALRPNFIQAMCNLGNLLRERGEWAEALQLLESAYAQDPDSVPAVSNLGVVLQDLGRTDEAQRLCERALALAPHRAELHVNLGTTYKDLGDPTTALAYYERALELDPHSFQAAHSRGAALLSQGDFAGGWAGYEQRMRCDQFDTRDFPQPRWDGAPLAGRTILIHAEQGFGDTLQFIRYLPQVAAQGGNVVVAVQPPLIPLLQNTGIPNLFPLDGPLPPFDLHVPLMSLPHVLGTTLDTAPRDVPYLAAPPDRIAAWCDRLQAYPGFRVGLVWQGRPDHHRDCLRSIPLAAFRPLADVPGVRLISLQQGPGSEQLAALAALPPDARFGVIDLGSEYGADGTLFMDAAAVIANLDLVIACDTGLAHLAGGMAAPVWVALPLGAEWRWMQKRDDSPWYPTMRLFRQTKFRDWDGVFQRMAAALAEEAGGWRPKAGGDIL